MNFITLSNNNQSMDKVIDILEDILQSKQVCFLKDCMALFSDDIEVYLCGGFLRNYISGACHSKDIDIFVKADRDLFNRYVQRLSRYGRIEYGQYGSPRLFLDNHTIIEYIDIVPFYNFIVTGEDIRDINQLLCSFDITANAIGLNIKNGEFYNPVNGVADIKNRVLRAVRLDFPEMNISSEIILSAVTVFWFRLIHYQAVLDYSFDDNTRKWVSDNSWRMRDRSVFERYFFPVRISQEVRNIITESSHVYK